MPQNYEVQYTTNPGTGGTWTSLTNVQDLTISIGRQVMLDQYSASTGSITVRYPTGYASPIAEMVPGTYIRVNLVATGAMLYMGRIKDVSVDYGIPYSGGVGNADYLHITVEGFFSTASRMAGQSYSLAAGNLGTQMMTVQSVTGLSITYDFAPDMGAATVSSTWGDWINQVLVTTNGRMVDCNYQNTISLRGPYTAYTTTVNFSDAANDATNQVYDTASFGAWSDNYYTQVTVTPSGLTAQTATNAGAVAPYRTYQVNTLSASTGQALDQANFLLSQYGTQKFALTSVSCLAEAQSTFKLDNLGLVNFGSMVGSRVSVTFRGTTYYSVIEGVTLTATPASSRYTYYLSGADLNNYLILGNTIFGRLDYNKLGY